jgi:bifunctional DNA-binding transcriptional regulator/antitoxin component of YhaV-PrlF toxin-antitoxin module
MSYALTVKSQVTVPKAVRLHMGIAPGQAVDYEPLPDGSVRMYALPRETTGDNPFRKWRGTGVLKRSTEDILRETRGEESMR